MQIEFEAKVRDKYRDSPLKLSRIDNRIVEVKLYTSGVLRCTLNMRWWDSSQIVFFKQREKKGGDQIVPRQYRCVPCLNVLEEKKRKRRTDEQQPQTEFICVIVLCSIWDTLTNSLRLSVFKQS